VTLVGRDRELAVIADAIQRAASESLILTIDAEAGAGKSAVLEAARTAATAAGVRVLRCRPTATEADLAYAALGDLLESVTDLSAIDPMPRAALERALLRGDSSAPVEVDPRSVGSACAAVWRELVASGPLLVLIDDLHWLDSVSSAALLFSFRRLPATGMTVLTAQRTGEPCVVLPPTAEPVEVPPMAGESVMLMLAGRTRALPRRLSSRQLRAVVETSGGNPLYAIELARATELVPASATGELQIPSSLDQLIERRFGAVDDELGDALAAVALLARPDLAMMRRLGLDDAIDRAERDGLVDTSTGRVVFGHPLFAAAVLDRTTPSRRRSIHARLAAAVVEPIEVIRHRAHAAEQADASIAAELATASEALAGRGAFDHAADFAVLAATLTPVDDIERPARYASAGFLSFQRGESDAAMDMLGRIDRAVASSNVRMREMLIHATISFSNVGAGPARLHALEALEHCTTDVERIEVHSTLSRVSYDHFPTAAEHARIALELIEQTEVSNVVLANALVASAGTRFMSGEGLDRAMWQRAIELEHGAAVFSGDSAFGSFAALLKMVDELDEARQMFLTLIATTEDEGSMPYALSHLPQLELWSGNWDAAEEYAARHLDAALRTGQYDQVSQASNNLAMINTYRGDVDDAAAISEELIESGRASGDIWVERSGLGQLGLVALANGDGERAVELLGRWHELAEQMGLHEPGYCRLRPDYVEALVSTGRIEMADEYAQMMQSEAERLDRPTLLATACRVRALVAAARGERVEAVSLATEAVERSAATPLVVDHARALLTLGQIHRRFKEKSAARTALQDALTIFDRLGAERFAERARQDLARIGLRPATSTGLTETERRVAELAATRRTVRQVGDELFISPKTVEANLTRVYRKLAISGRAELATWIATQQPAV